ncbi:MAG: ATP-binding protein [Aggregatilineales bacterium]|nr:PAS domain-containing protein [Chloroflexota bacterium]
MDIQPTMRQRVFSLGGDLPVLTRAAQALRRIATPRTGPHRLFQPLVNLTAGVVGALAVFFLLRAIAARPDSPAALAFLAEEAALVVVLLLAVAASLIGGIVITARTFQPVFYRFEEEHARLTAILGSIADGVVLRNPEGHIILANPAAVELLTTEQGFDTEPLETLVEQPDSARRLEVGRRTIAVSAAPVATSDGATLGDVLVLRDVTREALVERTKDSFLDHIGHELRTPLTVIRGYVDVIRLGGDRLKPEVYERALSAILEQTGTLARMIDEIIDLTSMRSTGESAIQVEPVDLNQLVRCTVDDWREKFAAAGLVPVVETAQPITLQADARRLRRALDALVDNACHFSPQGGSVRVSTAQVNGCACISVSDSGVGISEKDLPHVFERFYRGEPVGPGGEPLDVRGIGQGLYLAKTIVEAHGGRIDVQSAAGAGSTFTIWLPLK